MPLVRIEDGCGLALHFSYDSHGLLREIRDAAHRRWTFQYAGARLVVIPHGSHGLVIERSKLVIDLIVNFVRESEGPPRAA